MGEQAVVDKVFVSLIAGLFLAVLLSVISLLIPFYYAIPIGIGAVLLALVIGIVWGVRRTPSLERSALAVDAKGNKERVITALGLAGREDTFSILQKTDALKVIEGFKIKNEFPLKLSLKKCGVFVMFAIIFGITGMLDTPARQLAVTRYEVKKEAAEETDKLEKLQKELDKSDKLTAVEKEELNRQLEQSKQDMRRAESVEDLKKAEDRITKKLEMDAENIEDISAKKLLADAVEQNKADQARRVEEAMNEALDAMDKVESGDKKSKRDAYEKLKKLAETTGDESLKRAANEYKNSDYSNNDYLAANQALQNAQDSMETSDIADNSNEQSNSGQDSSESGQQRDNYSKSNEDSKNEGESDANSGSKNSQNVGDSSGSGSDSDNDKRTDNSSGSGTGSDKGAGNGNGSGSGSGWNKGSKNGLEGQAKVKENVTIPDGTVGDDANLSGKANSNDTSSKQKTNQANTWSGNKVSYGQVSGEYKDRAYKKVNGSGYPAKMKKKIRNYFDGLE